MLEPDEPVDVCLACRSGERTYVDEFSRVFNDKPMLSRRRSLALPSRVDTEPEFKLRCLQAVVNFSSFVLSLADDVLTYLEISDPV